MNWVFILGGSSGFGLASAKLFAEKGYNIFIVHHDRKSKLKEVENEFENIRRSGVSFININTNAITSEGQSIILEKLKTCINSGNKIEVFLHSIAYGNINAIINLTSEYSSDTTLTEDNYLHTINAMGVSFITWSKLLLEKGFFADTARIIGITSEGSQKVIEGYSAVGAAKSVLESGCRYLAVELAPFGITTNLINAGITDTPALKALTSYENIIKLTEKKNPFKRLTVPSDVAKFIYLLTREEASWVNGEVIRVDGGEQINTMI